MPYTVTDPETKEIPVTTTAQQQFPVLRLTTMVWGLDVDTQERQLNIGWVEGYLDGDTFVRGQEYEAVFNEAEIAAKFDGAPEESTIWDDQRKACWELLVAHDPPYVPAGTIS